MVILLAYDHAHTYNNNIKYYNIYVYIYLSIILYIFLFQRPWLGSIDWYEVAWSIGGGRSQEFAAGHANASERSPPLASRCLVGWASWVWISCARSKFVGNKMNQSLRVGQCNPCVLSNLLMTRGRWDCFMCPGDSGPVLWSYSHRAGHHPHGEGSATALRDERTGQRLWSSRSRGQGFEQLPNMLISSFQVSSTMNRA